jgi:hypothetical protein
VEEVRLARLDLLRVRIAVAGRPALDHVGDIDVRPREADSAQQLLEQLAGLPDERDPVLILVEAGRLADEHQVCVRIARAEDDLRPGRRERAASAAQRFVAIVRQRVCHVPELTGSAGCLTGAARAAAAAAAAPAARALLRRDAGDREARHLLQHVARATFGAANRLLGVPDELLEMRLALHARVLVDRHGRSLALAYGEVEQSRSRR